MLTDNYPRRTSLLTVLADPPKFEVESYITNYTGTYTHDRPACTVLIHLQAVLVSTAFTSSAPPLHCSLPMSSNLLLPKPNQERMLRDMKRLFVL